MSILSLQRLNKNQFRKYPFKQGAASLSDDGYLLSDELIVDCSLTSQLGKHRLYIKQIFYSAPVLRIAVATISSDPQQDDQVVGIFATKAATAYSTLQLTPFIRFVSGSLTLGTLESLSSVSRVLNFPKESTEFEESTIFCYTHPAVTSIRDKKGSELRGRVNFGILTNVAKTTQIGSTRLYALTPSAVKNLVDKSTYLSNCSTPTITNINGVYPSSSAEDAHDANDANIYLVGVKPVVFYGIPGQAGVVALATEGISLASLCTQKHKLIPPQDIRGFTVASTGTQDLYYSKPELLTTQELSSYPYAIPPRLSGNFNTTEKPEFYYWPQFVKSEYYAYWRLTAPSVPTVLPSTNAGAPAPGELVISFVPPVNDGAHTITDYEYAISPPGEEFTAFLSSGTDKSPIILRHVPSGVYGIKIRAVNSAGQAGAETVIMYYSVT